MRPSPACDKLKEAGDLLGPQSVSLALNVYSVDPLRAALLGANRQPALLANN
jgi:hypothetical protein